MHLAKGAWITARAARRGPQRAVSLEASSPEERLEVFAQAHGMSVRERELLGMLADGSATKRIAQRQSVLSQILGTRAGRK